MNNFFRKIKKTFFNEGLIYIFGSSCLSQVCGLLSSIFVIRGLTKSDYGGYVQANNLYSYIAIFVGMGFAAGIMQFCSEPIGEKQKCSIYRYTLKKGSLFNIILFIVICVMADIQYILGNVITAKYILLMAAYPFFSYLASYVQIILRVKRKNREFAYVNIVYSVILLICNIIFTKLFGVIGLILSYYVAYLSSLFMGLYYCKGTTFLRDIIHDNRTTINKKEIDKYSLSCAVSNFAYGILLLIDVTCISIVIANSEILANYKVASTIPSALVFVSTCLMTFYYPQIVETYYGNRDIFNKFLIKLFLVFGSVNFIIFIIGEFFAPSIIRLLYGDNYLDSVPLFRILILNFFISATVRKIMGNMIVIIKKVQINFFHSVISGVLNIILDIILIQKMGATGAAIATTICTVFMAVLEIRYIHSNFRKQKIVE